MKIHDWFTDKKAEQEYKERDAARRLYLSKTSNEQLIIAALLDLNRAFGAFTDKAVGDELYRRLPKRL